MPADAPQLVQAVEAAIVAAAHAAAYERVAAATHACRRLGQLSAGRWRSATRDLERLEQDLQTSLEGVSADLERRAESLGIEEEALWTVGDAAAVYDALREEALSLVEDDAPAASLLQSDVLYGVTLVEDEASSNRGTTLLFGWADPLQPAAWAWETSWIAAAEGEQGDEELELFGTGELEAPESLLAAVSEALSGDSQRARVALEEAASALTRASILAASDALEPDDDEDPAPLNGHT